MTEPGDVLTDPVAAVVAVVTTVDPAVDRDTVRAAVGQAGGPARRRRLAVALAADPSLLTSGRSPAPTVVGDLLLALRAAGAAGISPPRCAGCDREITSLQRHGQDWYCCVCVRRLAPRPCASCGQRRPVASRDRVGGPRCDRCPDRDERDPLAVLTAIISGLDSSLPADMAAGAARRVFARQGNLRRLAWVVEDRPALLTGEGARAPTAAVLRADRRAVRRRSRDDHPAGLPALRPGRPPAPPPERAVELPQLRRQGQRRALQPLRRGPRAGHPRRRPPAAVPELPGQRPGQPGRMRPLRTTLPR